ncbi:MAG: mannonate dehydratase [Balneola sp.]|uniref:mannonate dehydratase n=1 Tax=Balneola sp. EhC07 TaxID=1849360 RepID=UPI0007F33DA1|nr:mannonate dehydratase [Balneola sp. EhC07]OAN60665.1 mannonate dehydratase [Balneola sp. EhC07]
MSMIQSWRWYGPNDDVTLSDIEQAGAYGVVHALHHIPVGQVWTVLEIEERQKFIEWDASKGVPRNLKWIVVESLNVHESIKKGLADRDELIDNYKESLRNLAACGIQVVCYNFMPVLDWTRTDLNFNYKDGSKALRFDSVALAAFDIFILKRQGAVDDYDSDIKEKAKLYFKKLSAKECDTLAKNILQGVPGSGSVLTLDEFRSYLKLYEGITKEKLRENLKYFLQQIIPVAQELNIKLCCHPDDPPHSIFGLPRIVSTEEDLNYLVESVKSPSNGITFCTGSLGPNPENDLPGIVNRLGEYIHFVHLRNIQREESGSFHEADHLDGSVDMYKVMRALVKECDKRKENGRSDYRIPFRPDHGHQMLDDLNKKIKFHGYSAIGRLRGLAELRGLEEGIRRNN